MHRPTAERLWKSRALRRIIVAVVLLEVAVVAALYGIDRYRLSRDRNAVTFGGDPGPFTRKIELDGLTTPPALAAGSAGLRDDEEVIGVMVAGHARAYRIKALENPPWHIVNDLIGGVPVSVAYCNLTGCTQVYTSDGISEPLPISQAGLYAGEMVVRVDGILYVHKTGRPLDATSDKPPLPYANLPLTRTNWGEWKRQHPLTDVFIGPKRRQD